MAGHARAGRCPEVSAGIFIGTQAPRSPGCTRQGCNKGGY